MLFIKYSPAILLHVQTILAALSLSNYCALQGRLTPRVGFDLFSFSLI